MTSGSILLLRSSPTGDPDSGVIRVANETSTKWFFIDFEADVNDSFVLSVHGCWGLPGDVEVWTHRLIWTFYYEGQADLYLGYWHLTQFDGVSYEETGGRLWNITVDFRAGLWLPEDGIEFRHSPGQVFGNATLTGIPSGVVIPEFSSTAVVVVALILLVAGLRRQRA